ncbi:MAG: DMT family transporter [Minwuia sp.]|uniref:DMT family transporter n=1 Tax=Minwuia sp. TaxID=2493630 RepID=UPI003A8B1A43
MTNTAAYDETNRPLAGIVFILAGMSMISVNDVLVKYLSDGYPLHQIVLVRSLVGICFSLVMVQFEGGWRILKTDRPILHILRGLLIVVANLTFFMALAAMPIGEATAIFFVAPLFITLLSVVILGESVGIRRIGAVIAGFAGVVVMLNPLGRGGEGPGLLVALLPIVAAFTYASFQIMTRKLGASARASAMAVYIQTIFIVVSLGFFLVVGDGRLAEETDNPSLIFIFRVWVWPPVDDWPVFAALGVISAGVAYALSQAYRVASAATVAPFEYVALPLATLWGFLIFHETPDLRGLAGMALILGAGLYILARERRRGRVRRDARPVRR